MAYAKSKNVEDSVDDVLAAQYNALRAEVKAAGEGLNIGDDCDIALTLDGGPGSDQLSVVTIVDNAAVASYDIDVAATVAFDANGFPTQIASVFSILGITRTSALTFTDGELTGIGCTLS